MPKLGIAIYPIAAPHCIQYPQFLVAFDHFWLFHSAFGQFGHFWHPMFSYCCFLLCLATLATFGYSLAILATFGHFLATIGCIWLLLCGFWPLFLRLWASLARWTPPPRVASNQNFLNQLESARVGPIPVFQKTSQPLSFWETSQSPLMLMTPQGSWAKNQSVIREKQPVSHPPPRGGEGVTE